MSTRSRGLCSIAFICLVLLFDMAQMAARLSADEKQLRYEVELRAIHQELTPEFCWFHPRMASVPGIGEKGNPLLLLTLQKHLVADDHYSGLHFMTSRNGGDTWSKPVLPSKLDWQVEEENVTVAVCDVTPGYHPRSGKVLAIGTKLRYSSDGRQLTEAPRSQEIAYAVFDPDSGDWQSWEMLSMPEFEQDFFITCPGCVQWLVRPDGSILLPVYHKSREGNDYSVTVLLCEFDGQTLSMRSRGQTLWLAGGRGLAEPSLTMFAGRYFLTLRNNSRGYVTSSNDGLNFNPIQPWSFDDGSELGSYNTQQHWVTHSQGLLLSYTRRGANNDHIPRNRAPIFLARVDPARLVVERTSERILIPERGAMLGNFGVANVSPHETWVTDAEFIQNGKKSDRGADGTVFGARIFWNWPNTLTGVRPKLRIVALGDSITKGVRAGVKPEETFCMRLQDQLREKGAEVEIVNVGVGGERTDGALARLQADVIALEPVLVTIMYGTNDSYVDLGQAEERIAPETYRKNLEDLVHRLRAQGIKPVLMTEPRWGSKASNTGAGEHPNLRLEKYINICRNIARETDSPLVDHFRFWTDSEQSGTDLGEWTTDQCHPNPRGHEVMADLMLPVLLQELRKLIRK